MSSRRLCGSLPKRAPLSRSRRIASGGLDSKVVLLDCTCWRFAGRREGNAMRSRLGRLGDCFCWCRLALCGGAERCGLQGRFELRGASGCINLFLWGLRDLFRGGCLVLQTSGSSDRLRLRWCWLLLLFLLLFVFLLLFLDILLKPVRVWCSQVLCRRIVDIHLVWTLHLLQSCPHATLLIGCLHRLCFAQISCVRGDADDRLSILRFGGSSRRSV